MGELKLYLMNAHKPAASIVIYYGELFQYKLYTTNQQNIVQYP